MNNLTVNSNNYDVSQAELLANEQVNGKNGTNVADPTKIPDAIKNTAFENNDKPDMPKPTTFRSTQQFANECDLMLDSLAKVIGELQKIMSKQRETNTNLIVSSLQAAKAENLSAAQSMKEEAEKTMALQIVGAGISIIMSAVSFGITCKACNQTLNLDKNLDAMSKSAEAAGKTVTDEMTELFKKQLEAGAKKIEALGTAMGATGNSVKSLFDAIANRVSTDSQASTKESDAVVQEIQATIEKLKELNESVKDVQRKALETLSAVSQSEVDVLRKLTV